MLDHVKSARGLLAAALVACCGALLFAASARAACGGVEQENPRKDVNLGRAPIAIGDSPMLLALADLAQEGYRANARGCRQYPEGLDLVRTLKHQDRLPRLVVIALGSNGVISKGDLREALDLVGKKRNSASSPRASRAAAGAMTPSSSATSPMSTKTASTSSTGSSTAPATRAGSSPTACTSPSTAPTRWRGCSRSR
jgi:hypothetical protein